eukprot:CAMPEP_0118966054 /NCGR_PEP_ID=MMETSP1173-20130426/3557_1 /TAXON_ID=1034831 /ORGANISM="Rhizochromulina marina cf, Strain CCMP1243" /LENGTH=287 /DNA_ID=CAMNT_0006914773 /DNA_START=87 /DNA_END=950 /DNA_ORIENTATION=-
MADAVNQTPSRPALLTLTGLYQTSKSVYVSYMPEGASKTVESLAERILSVSSPYVASLQKTLPKGSEEQVEKTGEPLELSVAKLDSLVASLCVEADSRVDQLIATSSSRLSTAKTSVKSAVETKAEAVKSVVHETLGTDRVAAFQERCTDLSSTASSYYATAQEYTPAARHVALQYGQLVQSEVSSKGIIATARLALGWARDQALSTATVLQEQGLVAGSKSIFASAAATVTSTLQEARLEAATVTTDKVKEEEEEEEEEEEVVEPAQNEVEPEQEEEEPEADEDED